MAVLTTASWAPGAPKKDTEQVKDQQFTQIYSHTYDEVFQAAQETIERMGMFVTDKDKDKGTISGNGEYHYVSGLGPGRLTLTFNIVIETVSAKAETRVTINEKHKGHALGWEKAFKKDFLSELQKMLATYH